MARTGLSAPVPVLHGNRIESGPVRTGRFSGQSGPDLGPSSSPRLELGLRVSRAAADGKFPPERERAPFSFRVRSRSCSIGYSPATGLCVSALRLHARIPTGGREEPATPPEGAAAVGESTRTSSFRRSPGHRLSLSDFERVPSWTIGAEREHRNPNRPVRFPGGPARSGFPGIAT
ncbi:hypothetical protein NL676_015665 [Syzygium grande]|nr:hypothetical protein NL676_015665 [Syzygium grande]